MSAPDFSDAPIPEDIPQTDIAPDDGPHCQVCGTPLEYSGRGRKPKYCSEHRRSGARNTTSVKASTPRNEKLAAQATDALLQINGLVALLAAVAQYENTAEAITSAEETFRVRVHAALITDPELAQSILKAGTASGKISLIIAYGMLATAVAPVAVVEYKMKRLEKESAAAAAADEETGQ